MKMLYLFEFDPASLSSDKSTMHCGSIEKHSENLIRKKENKSVLNKFQFQICDN